MMGFYGEGEITQIKNYKDNIIIVIRDMQIPYTTSEGYKVGERDFRWFLVPRTNQEAKFYKKSLFVGAKVWFSGKISQKKKKESDNEDEDINRSDITFRIDRMDLFNNSDPKKQGMRERYNTKAIGDDKPDTFNSFDNDF